MNREIFIPAINEALKNLSEAFVGSRILGLAESIMRGSTDQEQIFPAIIDPNGEAKPIDVNDVYPITIYHKQNSVSISEKNNSSFGDSRALKIYSYSNVMLVHINGLTVKKTSDEILLLIEANIPDSLKVLGVNLRSVQLKIETAIVNSLTVFNNEYKNVPYRLPLNYYLMAIYYKIDALFDKKCLNKCP